MSDIEQPDESSDDVFRRDAESIWDQHQAAKGESDEPQSEAMQQLVGFLEHLSRYPRFEFETLANDLNLDFQRDPNIIASKWKTRIASLQDGPFSRIDLSIWPEQPERATIDLDARPRAMPISYQEVAQLYGLGEIVDVVHIDHWGNDGDHRIASGFTTYVFEPLNGKRLSMSFFTKGHILRSARLATITD